jgi:hypothetical protein
MAIWLSLANNFDVPIKKCICEVKEINGTTYIFYKLKSGDYTDRGMAQWYKDMMPRSCPLL